MDTTSGLQVHNSAAGRSLLEGRGKSISRVSIPAVCERTAWGRSQQPLLSG